MNKKSVPTILERSFVVLRHALSSMPLCVLSSDRPDFLTHEDRVAHAKAKAVIATSVTMWGVTMASSEARQWALKP